MKIVFFGTGRFALPTLDMLVKSDRHEVAAIVTGPDKKKGRGWNVRPTAIRAYIDQVAPATEVLQPEKVSDASFIDALKGLGADLFVVVDYGQFLNREVLDMPRKYCVNLHASLLPKYRGASPVNRAIVNGDEKTGNSVIKMNEGMDAGSVIMQEETRIGEYETSIQLYQRLSQSGAELMMNALEVIEAGEERFVEQDEAAASYAPKLQKKEGKIDWSVSAVEIIRKVRGMQPWPGAFTMLKDRNLKIIEAKVADSAESGLQAGTVIDTEKFIVSAGAGAVRVNRLQLEGKKAMARDEFLRGFSLEEGTVLG